MTLDAYLRPRLGPLRIGELDVRRLNLHALRHCHACLLLDQGVPIKVVSERLGHSTIAMTMDVYAHVLPAQDRDASAAIRRALQGQGGGRGPTSHP